MTDDSASKDRFDLRNSAVPGVYGKSPNQQTGAYGKEHLCRVSRAQDVWPTETSYRENDVEDVFNGERASCRGYPKSLPPWRPVQAFGIV